MTPPPDHSETDETHSSAVGPSSDGWRDLLPRTLSALVLIPAGLWVSLQGGPWLAGAAGAAVLAMSYEWARMSEPDALIPAFFLCLIGSLGAVMFASWDAFDRAFLWMGAFSIASSLRRRSLAGACETAGGVVYVGLGPVVLLWLRDHDNAGALLVIGLFAIIWAADSGAYFGGRLLGGPLLMPRLSPAKTWAGLGCGMLAGATTGVVVAAATGGLMLGWAIAGLALALVGLGGDLLESALKRRFGVKDASRLIPGHGGVLDRLDGMIAATIVTGAVVALEPNLWAVLTGRA